MDLETENRIAAILMKEAAELRKQAEKEGVRAYLEKPQARGRPNSRFLSATVRGVQQANRAVEVNEMWRVRQKELELDDRLKGRLRDESSSDRSHRDVTTSYRSRSKHSASDKSASASCSPSKRASDDCHSEDGGGLKDEEIEEFLHSRVKRGRGAVGSRMDETGPYFPPNSKEKLSTSPDVRLRGEWERRVLGPQKPSALNPCESSEDELDQDRRKKARKVHSGSSHKDDSKKHGSKKSKDKKKKKRKEEKRCKHRK